MRFLEVSGLSRKESGRVILYPIHFTQQPLEKIAIAGETGCGKTTLLKLIAGLLQPDEGMIYFEGERVRGAAEKLIPGHPRIAYLSQHFELRNNYRVAEELEARNLLTPEEAQTIYSVCKIGHLLQRKTTALSGGERQRIVLARLLTTAPKLVLLDEPFSNLDAIHKNSMKSVLSDIGERLNVSCILVSHDGEDVLSWADRILVMKDGKIIQQGTPREIYFHPVDEYCAGLFGYYTVLSHKNALSFSVEGTASVNGQALIVRPGQFRMVPETDKAVKGMVKAIFFFGTYYQADIAVNDQVVRIITNNEQLSTGDIVYLSLNSTMN